MTKELEKALKYYMLEGIVNQVKHEYEDEADFEEKYGKTDTLDEVASLYCDIKSSEDVDNMLKKFIEAFPEEYNELLDYFDITLSDIGLREYITWGYDKDNDVWEEYYRGIDKDKAIEIAIEKSDFMDKGNLKTKNGEPIDWIEVVDSKAEYKKDYSNDRIWASYEDRDEDLSI